MKKLTCAIALYLTNPTVFANSTICELEESTTGVKSIVWNKFTLAAKVTDDLNIAHNGKITLTREHEPFGKKINIFVKYEKPYYGDDAAEYIIFPTDKNKHRVIGVTYKLEDNKYHLNTSKGNYKATCHTRNMK